MARLVIDGAPGGVSCYPLIRFMVPSLPPPAGLHPFFYIPENDLTGSTFFFSMFALLGAAVFFFMERRNVPRRWHTNVTVAGLICLVAGISYFYMQSLYIN